MATYQNATIAQLLEAIIGQINFDGEPISNIGDILLSILEKTPYEEEPKSVIADLFLKLKAKLEDEPFDSYEGDVRSVIARILISILNETEYTGTADSRIAQLLLELKAELESYVELIAQGAIANFTTSVSKPLVNLTAYFNATQESGTPTPQSPKAISGVSAVNVVHLSGSENTSTAFRGLLLGTHDFIQLSQLTWIYQENNKAFITTDLGSIIKKPANITIMPYFISSKYDVIKRADIVFGTSDKVITEQITGTVIACDLDYTDAQTFANSLEGEYLIYELDTPKTPTITKAQFDTLLTAFDINGTTEVIALGGTYYGGYVSQDKNGHRQLVDNGYKSETLLSGISWNEDTGRSGVFYGTVPSNYPARVRGSDIKCCSVFKATNPAPNASDDLYISGKPSYSGASIFFRNSAWAGKTREEIQSLLVGASVVYELANPFTIELPDGEPITAFNGVNNVYNDSGDSKVIYLAKISDNLERTSKSRAFEKAEKAKLKEKELENELDLGKLEDKTEIMEEKKK